MTIVTRCRALSGAALFGWLAFFGSAGQAAAQEFKLGLPVDCDMQLLCSIHKYVDHDPGPGRQDFACGRLSKDGDKGTDFRVPNLAVMEAGVAVIAAADGVVRATREGMRDVSVREIGQDAIKGRFAGNAVVLTHPSGWETQYSHLKRGSVRVKKGDYVSAGEVIGEIGLSGNTEFPHVEFGVRKDGKAVDPFVGIRHAGESYECGAPRSPLWDEIAQQELEYRASGVLTAGFTAQKPSASLARKGDYATARLSADSPALIFWVDLFGSENGDTQHFQIMAPNGEELLNQKSVLKENNIALFSFAGKKRPARGWMTGRYEGQYTLTRNGRIVAEAKRIVRVNGE